MHPVTESCFAIRITEAAANHSPSDVVEWLRTKVKPVTMQTELTGGWQAMSCSGPREMARERNCIVYAITTHFIR